MDRILSALTLGLLVTAPVLAQSPASPMPGMSMAGMSSSIDLKDPMSQEASGRPGFLRRLRCVVR